MSDMWGFFRGVWGLLPPGVQPAPPRNGPGDPRTGSGVVLASDYSTPVPVVYGTARVGGNTIYVYSVRQEINQPTTQSYDNNLWKQADVFYSAVGVALCEGPIQGLAQSGTITGLKQIEWFNRVPHYYGTMDKLGPQIQVWVGTGGSGVSTITLTSPGAGVPANPTLADGRALVEVGDILVQIPYAGNQAQLGVAWGIVTSVTGASSQTIGLDRTGNWSAGQAWVRHAASTVHQFLGARPGTLITTQDGYSLYNGGTAWIHFRDLLLTSGSPPSDLAFEVSGFLLRGGAGAAPLDANPSAVALDLLTSTIYGPGLPPSHVDVVNGPDGTAASGYDAYCKAIGWYVSGALVQQSTALDVLRSLCQVTNSVPIWSQGKLRITPLGDTAASSVEATFTPAVTATSLGANDFLVERPGDDPIAVERVSPADVYNVFPIEFPARTSEYNKATVESMDTGAIQSATPPGLIRRASKLSGPWVIDPTQAQAISILLARMANYARQTFRFKVGWRYCFLEPTDFVALNDPIFPSGPRIARIISIEELPDLTFEIVAIDWPFGIGQPTPQVVQTMDGVTHDTGEKASGYVQASTQTAVKTSAADNLVPNGNSEMGTAALAAGGVAAAALVQDATNAYAGSWCREILSTGAAQAVAVTDPLPCRVGDVFFASAQIKVSLATTGIAIAVVFLDGGGNVLSTTSTTGGATTAYALFSLTTAAAPAGTCYAQLQLTVGALAPGVTAYWDQLYMRRVIDTPIIGAGQVTRPTLVAVGQQVSASSGAYLMNSSTPANVTNLSVTLTTTGRPVVVGILSDGGGTMSGILSQVSVAGNANALTVLRDGTVVDRLEFGATTASVAMGHAPPGLCALDVPAAGSHTYTVQAYCGVNGAPNAIGVYYCVLVAYEL